MFAQTFPTRRVRAADDGGHPAYGPVVTTFVTLGASPWFDVGNDPGATSAQPR